MFAPPEDDEALRSAVRDALRPENLMRSPAAAVALIRVIPPIVGVVALGWNAADWVAFWFVETVVIGLVNVPRILTARGAPAPSEQPQDPSGRFSALFFILHYGFFVAIQWMFLENAIAGLFSIQAFLARDDVLQFTAVALGIECADFIWRGLVRHEADLYSPGGQMFRPYPRIFVQQFTVLLGVWVALGAGILGEAARGIGVFAVLLAVRVIADVVSPLFDRALRTPYPYVPGAPRTVVHENVHWPLVGAVVVSMGIVAWIVLHTAASFGGIVP